ncbi:DUF484 family protein [Reinekea sp.]|uniref:DUF484 family protein n=1 Tax=Reinekea sp. TaxID=1970455 RepID=UPI002A7FB2E2|nr:DUF484 family protein [Reinekea sp.]
MTKLFKQLGSTEADVVRYLKLHPTFFENHPNLLKTLHIRHDSGKAISLLERQNSILRSENSALIEQLNEFISVAQRNDRLFLNLQALVLELIKCRTLNDISRTLTQELLGRFEVDEVRLVFTHLANSDGDLWLYCDPSLLEEHFPATLAHLKNQCGEFEPTARQVLFGASDIRSMAIAGVALNGQGIGLLALGSRDARHFRSSTDTLFLGYVAKVVSQLLVRF